MPYYAVRKGRKVGIYETWPECEAQVKKFPGAQFKKFATQSDAQAFIDQCPPSNDAVVRAEASGPKKRSHESEDDHCNESSGDLVLPTSSKRARTSGPDDTSFTVVYTDGACTNNGWHSARGGIGVYWGPNDARNVSEPLPPGRQTNNRAEILACARAIEQAKKSGIAKLEIRTDSRFTINCLTLWLAGWMKKGWRTAVGKPVQNMEELIILHEQKCTFEKEGGKIKFTHVRGHHGEPGNEAADRLATDGVLKSSR